MSVSFNWSPSKPFVGQPVRFTSTSTTSSNNAIVDLLWDLNGDGVFGDRSGSAVTTSFSQPGDHVVQLRVVDKHGAQHNHVGAETVTVALAPSPLPTNQPPVASFAYYPAAAVAGEAVTFYSTATDPDSAIAAQRWDLDGDGRYADALGPAATRRFPLPGAYKVGLQVEDTAGAVSTGLRIVTVANSSTATALAGLRPLFPSPVVRLAGTIMRMGITVRRLTASAPAGARTAVRCRGRNCPFRWRRYRHRSNGATSIVNVERLHGRYLRAGALLQVFITRRDAIGRYTRFRIRGSKPPARIDRCLISLSRRPVSCASP